jgi:tRNA-dihydrouridine synthase
MIGRGIFGKPWLFSKSIDFSSDSKMRLKILKEHIKIFDKELSGIKNFDVMKKHFKAYVSGWDGAKDLRVSLMATKSANEALLVINRYLLKI